MVLKQRLHTHSEGVLEGVMLLVRVAEGEPERDTEGVVLAVSLQGMV